MMKKIKTKKKNKDKEKMKKGIKIGKMMIDLTISDQTAIELQYLTNNCEVCEFHQTHI